VRCENWRRTHSGAKARSLNDFLIEITSQGAEADEILKLKQEQGKNIFNPGVPPQSFAKFLKWVTRRKIGPWRKFVTEPPGPRPDDRVNGSQLRVTFVNHSTFLLQSEASICSQILCGPSGPVPFLFSGHGGTVIPEFFSRIFLPSTAFSSATITTITSTCPR